MGFIFGLMVGSAISSGGGHIALPPIIGTIPFRCLAAYEISETDYRNCRYPSLYAEIIGGQTTPCSYGSLTSEKSVCNYEMHMRYELAALAELKKATMQRPGN